MIAAWTALALDLIADGRPCVLVTVTATDGSTPREAGARMLVWQDGTSGSIGGGQLEFQATAMARRLLADPIGARPVNELLNLGPALEQCCGGRVRLLLEPLTAASRPWLEAWREPDESLLLFGAGHVGQALVRILAALPYRIRWVDSRPAMLPAAIPGNVRAILTPRPALEVDQAAPGTLFLVMTHSHPLDLEICDRVLRRGDFGFLGLIGSATKRARFVKRLRLRGHGDAVVARLTCPIGIAGIASKDPNAIAIAVAAQLLQRAAAVAATRPIEAAGGER